MNTCVRLKNACTKRGLQFSSSGLLSLMPSTVHSLSIFQNQTLIRKQYCNEPSTNIFETTKNITLEQVKSFAELTNDSNPIHLEQNDQTQIPIVHGALLLSMVAGVMGSHFPGPGSIVISQQMNFIEACPVGTNVKIQVELKSSDIAGLNPRRRKITDCNFSCTDAKNYSVCYMKGTARLRIKS